MTEEQAKQVAEIMNKALPSNKWGEYAAENSRHDVDGSHWTVNFHVANVVIAMERAKVASEISNTRIMHSRLLPALRLSESIPVICAGCGDLIFVTVLDKEQVEPNLPETIHKAIAATPMDHRPNCPVRFESINDAAGPVDVILAVILRPVQ